MFKEFSKMLLTEVLAVHRKTRATTVLSIITTPRNQLSLYSSLLIKHGVDYELGVTHPEVGQHILVQNRPLMLLLKDLVNGGGLGQA